VSEHRREMAKELKWEHEREVEAYLAARADFVGAQSRLANHAKLLRGVSDDLSNVVWKITPEAYSQWKSAEQVQDLLTDCRRLHEQVIDLWEAIPERLREGLQSPPPIGLDKSSPTGFRPKSWHAQTEALPSCKAF
jgi:hypothetical protein